jgi:quinohemoprotein ethanol dehydrogenase
MNTINFLFLFPLACSGLTHAADVSTKSPENSEWRLIGQSPEQQHFSPMSQINDKNVEDLGLAWNTDMPTKNGSTGVPLAADGVVYQSGALGKVFANDARTGQTLDFRRKNSISAQPRSLMGCPPDTRPGPVGG